MGKYLFSKRFAKRPWWFWQGRTAYCCSHVTGYKSHPHTRCPAIVATFFNFYSDTFFVKPPHPQLLYTYVQIICMCIQRYKPQQVTTKSRSCKKNWVKLAVGMYYTYSRHETTKIVFIIRFSNNSINMVVLLYFIKCAFLF